MGKRGAYRLCDIINDYSTVGIPVIHWGKGLVSLLACGIPDLELYGCGFIEGDGLRKESGADRGLAVVVELILCSG